MASSSNFKSRFLGSLQPLCSLRSCVWASCFFAIVPLFLTGCGDAEKGNETVLSDDLFPSTENSSTPIASPIVKQNLKLNLKKGDRFPLIKTIERELSQSALGNKMEKSHSRIELVMAITVEETKDDQKRLGVRYTRVKYSHKLPNETIQYDSNLPPAVIPEVVRPYHGLVNNGFSFWVGANNQIIDLVDFPIFLERCLEDISPENREKVMTMLSRSSGRDGVVNFIDDSIGLLPYNANDPKNATMVSAGTTWKRTHKATQPVSMVVNQNYTIKELNDKIAKINVIGTILPSAVSGPKEAGQKDVQLQIKNGSTFGSCTIDVKTGLPIESKTEQFLDMSVSLGQGIQFDQKSRVVTTVRAFPQQQRPAEKVARQPNRPLLPTQPQQAQPRTNALTN